MNNNRVDKYTLFDYVMMTASVLIPVIGVIMAIIAWSGKDHDAAIRYAILASIGIVIGMLMW